MTALETYCTVVVETVKTNSGFMTNMRSSWMCDTTIYRQKYYKNLVDLRIPCI